MSNIPYTIRAHINRQRRMKQVRRNLVTLTISLFMVITMSMFLISFSTEANDMEHQPCYKYYKSIEVSKGDTLWSIAQDNIDTKYYKSTCEYVAEVKKINLLTSDNIVAGSHIIIPYYSTEFKAN
ncbi:MAG: LysM peptidoglycan-binding domain-containing protein [Lachnospiraceae bacterium]|nr:LysM peptidoglycan-binding domain-containing protein [Lachnospiraceae bacterium]